MGYVLNSVLESLSLAIWPVASSWYDLDEWIAPSEAKEHFHDRSWSFDRANAAPPSYLCFVILCVGRYVWSRDVVVVCACHHWNHNQSGLSFLFFFSCFLFLSFLSFCFHLVGCPFLFLFFSFLLLSSLPFPFFVISPILFIFFYILPLLLISLLFLVLSTFSLFSCWSSLHLLYFLRLDLFAFLDSFNHPAAYLMFCIRQLTLPYPLPLCNVACRPFSLLHAFFLSFYLFPLNLWFIFPFCRSGGPRWLLKNCVLIRSSGSCCSWWAVANCSRSWGGVWWPCDSTAGRPSTSGLCVAMDHESCRGWRTSHGRVKYAHQASAKREERMDREEKSQLRRSGLSSW